MDKLEKEFVYLTIKKKKPEDKRYLISNFLREKLKEEKNYYIGIIPYYSITNPIYNINREFFVNNSYFIVKDNQEIINIKITENELNGLDKSERDDFLKNKVKEFINKNLEINEIKESNLKKILDIENKKVKIYLVNINKKLNSKKKKEEKEYNLEELFQNLILKEKIKLKTINYIDFYNIWSDLKTEYIKNDKKKNTKLFKSRDFKKKLYKSINSVQNNKNVFDKTFKFYINDDNIQIRLKHIYNNMFT